MDDDVVAKLEELVSQIDELYRRNPNLQSLEIWHAKTRGVIIKLFAEPNEVVSIWNSIDTDFPYDYEYEAFDKGIPYAEYYDKDDEAHIAMDYRRYSFPFIQDAKRILLEFITLAVSGKQPTSDDYFASVNVEFGFIDNADLRKHCKDHYKQARDCYSVLAYSAANAMLGFVLEGILLSIAMQCESDFTAHQSAPKNEKNQKDKNAVLPVSAWSLDALGTVAKALGWIDDETFRYLALTRDTRNYLHPGKQLRNPREVDITSTRAFLNTIEKCVRDINRKLRDVSTQHDAA